MSDYKVSFCPALHCDAMFERECTSLEEAKAVSNAVADYTLLLHESNLMEEYSNYGQIFIMENGEWVEIDEDGNYI